MNGILQEVYNRPLAKPRSPAKIVLFDVFFFSFFSHVFYTLSSKTKEKDIKNLSIFSDKASFARGLMMRAIILQKPGGPEELILKEIPKPIPKDNEILIEVKAASLNGADVLQRKGKYPPPKGASPLLGLDISGVVVDVGKNVSKWKVNDCVMSLLEGGGYAEYAVAHEDLTLAIPEGFSFIEAAAIPEVFLTAYQALFLHGKIKKDSQVLIHAGASGVGTAAIQLVKAAKAHSFVTTSSLEKMNACLNLGAKGAFNYANGNFSSWVLEKTSHHGVDLILDFIGADYWEQNIQALAQGGILILLSLLSKNILENLDLGMLMTKWLTVVGTTLRSRPLKYKKALVTEFANFALHRFASKELQPLIYATFPLDEAAKAHTLLEKRKHTGKIVLFN